LGGLRIITCILAAELFTGCGQSDPLIDQQFDICGPIGLDLGGATPAQRSGVVAAIGYWRGRNVDLLADHPIDGAPTIPIVFQPANSIYRGYYDDEAAIIYINEDLDSDPGARAITIAHELGHAFGLHHVPADERDSLMNPHNLTIGPTLEDERQLTLLWGSCTQP